MPGLFICQSKMSNTGLGMGAAVSVWTAVEILPLGFDFLRRGAHVADAGTQRLQLPAIQPDAAAGPAHIDRNIFALHLLHRGIAVRAHGSAPSDPRFFQCST
jgi:hypothetical protein